MNRLARAPLESAILGSSLVMIMKRVGRVLTKLGGVLVLAAGAFGWAVDHFHWWSK